MNDFLNSIKITDKDKKDAISKILYAVINSPGIMSLNEVLQFFEKQEKYFDDDIDNKKQIEQSLSENEILAAYALSKEIKISIMSSTNKELIEYLELSLASVNEDNLLKFINETIKDIELTKKRTPNVEWTLQVGKIFRRLQGKNPCNEHEEEEITNQWSKSSEKKMGKIIDLSKYWEK